MKTSNGPSKVQSAPDAWPALLRPQQAARYLGLGYSRFYQTADNDPTFPRRIRLSNRCVGWRRAAVDAWLEAKERTEAKA